MAAKIMNISVETNKHKSQALEILDGFPTAFFADFYHCGFTRNNNLNYLPPTPPDSSEKERIKNMFGIIF